jgi:hypothetical protein
MDQRMNEPWQGRKKSLPGKSFRPCRGSIVASPFQGFATLTPGYFLIAPAGACVRKIVSRLKLFSQYLQWVGAIHTTKSEYRISNMECRMLKLHGRGKDFIIHNSMFDIRYSFRQHCKLIILELPTAEELAKHLPRKCILILSPFLDSLKLLCSLHDGFHAHVVEHTTVEGFWIGDARRKHHMNAAFKKNVRYETGACSIDAY